MGRWRGCEGGVGPRPPQAGAQPYASQAPYTAPSAPAGAPAYGQHGQYGQQPTAAYATAGA